MSKLRTELTRESIEQIKDYVTPKPDNREIIKDFLTKMAKQDNRCTAAPYFYVIRTRVKKPAPIDSCDHTEVYWDGETYDSMEHLKILLEDSEMTKEETDNALREANEYGVRLEWDHKGMFLTEDDAEDHLRLNHYHYSPDAHTYVDHAWRAPDMEEFFEALFKEFGVDQGSWR